MNRLPLEILRNIASYLVDETRWVHELNEQCPKTSLALYATISRQWQDIIEAFTFRHLIVTARKLTVAETGHYLSRVRLSHIRYIWFDFEFPAHDLAVSTDAQDYDDQLVFARTVKQLLGVLSQIPPRPRSVVCLEIFISTPRKYCTPWHTSSRISGEMDRVFSGSIRTEYLELPLNWDLDVLHVPAISYFRIELGSRSIMFSPSSINLIAAKMNRLDKVEWWLCDGEKVDMELRVRQRTSE
ncbi:hypothetical protein F66182_8652 [Fusarium sp. NRRL 66182]|nr:hypothetical protein F66182_8652 [Fusarium sp. NRRL 66182]